MHFNIIIIYCYNIYFNKIKFKALMVRFIKTNITFFFYQTIYQLQIVFKKNIDIYYLHNT